MDFKSKRILFMGDSITALDTDERGWVKYFNEIIKPFFTANVAVIGAKWNDIPETVYDGNPIWAGHPGGDDRHNVIGNQVEKILRGKDKNHPNYSYVADFEDFDYIFIAAGTNNYDFSQKFDDVDAVNRQFYKENGEFLPLEEVNRRTWAGAVRYTYENLRRMYPIAKIFICAPIQAAEDSRDFKSIRERGILLKLICERISDVTFVNTFECGICGIYESFEKEGRDLIDGLHPNKNGAKKIGEYNARALILSELHRS